MIIYGAGGHGKVLLSCLKKLSIDAKGFFDDKLTPSDIQGIQTLGKYDKNIFPNSSIIIGVGNNNLREDISKIVKHPFKTIVHPSADISDADIKNGCAILSHAVIQTGTKIGLHCIINIGVLVDHDCDIGDFSSIYPGCIIGSHVKIGRKVTIGQHSTIFSNISIADNSVIPPGSIVSQNIY